VVLSNSWSCYRRQPEDVDIGSYRNSINHPFNARVASVVQGGTPIVFAAGNCGNPCPDMRCGVNDRGPGNSIWGANSVEEVLTVTAVDLSRERIAYASQGPGILYQEKPDIAAFAHFQGYFPVDPGTSTAAPVAAGAVALILSAEPNRSAKEVFNVLKSTAKKQGTPGWDGDLGFGLIDCEAALAMLKN